VKTTTENKKLETFLAIQETEEKKKQTNVYRNNVQTEQ
jgi:hypothetical protein